MDLELSIDAGRMLSIPKSSSVAVLKRQLRLQGGSSNQIRSILSWSTIPKTKQEVEGQHQRQLKRRSSAPRPTLPKGVTRRDIVVKALEDHWPLAATVFQSEAELEGTKQDENENAVVIGSATGVPASFYHPYAAYLASQGSPTICFDYRLCGDSFPPTSTSPSTPTSGASLSIEDRNEILKLHPQVGFQQWAERDYASVLLHAWENLCSPQRQGGDEEKANESRGLSILGSSLGGHLFPLTIHHSLKLNPQIKVDRALFYSSINPYYRFTPDPSSTRRFGLEMLSWIKRDGFQDIIKWSLGNNIPLRAGLDWIEAAQEPNYTGSSDYMKQAFLDYKVDTLGLSFSDDHLAHGSPRRTDAFNRILGWPESLESEEEKRYWEEGKENKVMEGEGQGGTGSEAYLTPPDFRKQASERELENRRGWLNSRIFLDVKENGWVRGSRRVLEEKEDKRPARIGHVDAFRPSVPREVWELMRDFLQRGILPEEGSRVLGGRGGRRDFGC